MSANVNTKHPMVRLAVVVLILECLGAASLGAGLLTLNQGQANQAAIHDLNQKLDRAKQALDKQEAQQKQSAEITLHFLNEINYICETQEEFAKRAHPPLPPPPAGICNVTMAP